MIDWSVGNPRTIFFLTLLIAAFGLFSFTRLQVDAIPDITGVQVQVNTMVPLLAPQEIERLATLPLERAMAGQPGLQEVRSLTKTGLSQVTLIYKDGTDQLQARQLVTERLATILADLPPGSQPQLAPITTGLGEVFYYTLEWRQPPAALKPEQRLMELYEAQEYIAKPMLRTVEGVAEVNSNGGLEREFVVEPDLSRLTAAGVTASELADAVMGNAENAGGGSITRGDRRFTVLTNARVTNAAEIAALPVKFAAGVRPLTVGDLASVVEGHAPRAGAATANGQETVLGTVMMLVGQNSREVTQRVMARVPDVEAALPAGMVLHLQYNRGELVDRTIATVERNLGEGALLVVLVLLFVMGNWRAAVIVAAIIPLAFLVTVTGMHSLGVSGNLMSLGALDFGLIVDGSIVIVENALRRIRGLGHEPSPSERRTIVADAAREVSRPVAYGIAIITLVYVPILSLGGTEGKLFHPMAQAVMLALVGSLLAAFTITPALAALALRAGPAAGNDAETGFAGRLRRAYRPLLGQTLRQPLPVLGAAVVILIGSLLLFQTLGAQFTPRLDEGSVTAMVYKPVGMALDRSVAIEKATEQEILRRFPQVTRTFSRIGTSAVATDPMPPNENDLYLFYKPLDQWPRGPGWPGSKAELVTAIEKAATALAPQQSFLFAQPIEMRFNEMLEGTRADLSVKVFGDDYDQLERAAALAKRALERLPGTAGVEFESAGRTSSVVVELDRTRLLALGLSAAEVNRAVAAAIGGTETGFISEGVHRHAIVIRLPEFQRADPAALLDLPLRVGAGGMVPLRSVAHLSNARTVEPILHDDGQRRAALMVNLNTSDIEGYVQAARTILAREVKLPPGYRIEFGGQFRQLEQARARLMIVVPATLLVIFVLVYAAVGSVRQAALVYTGIPFAVTGGILALWLRGMPFSITAAIGFIALSGIAMLNGLVMVDQLNHLRRRMPFERAIREAAKDRLRPVIATALVASVGFLPMALATGAGAEVQRPLATVVIGGILSSTALTLLVLPTIYRLIERRTNRADYKVEAVEAVDRAEAA